MKKKTILIIGLSSIIALGAVGTSLGLYFALKSKNPALADFVEVFETTGTKSKLQARQADLAWRPYEFSGNTEVNVYPDVTKNVLHGAGVAITHSSAYLLSTLSEEKRADALESLFHSEEGALNFVRIPIGTSDYTNTDSFYTLDDMPLGQKDYDLAAFSLEKDSEYLIPALLNIKAINSDVIFVAAPWSAPAWMKTNESLIGGNLIAIAKTN
jgi:glucosylceramidase